MTNLEAKQEAIKKAYGEYWDLVKDLVRTDGSLSEPVWRGSDINIDYDDFSTGYFRPKSLKGIENNNGWIRIESETDLPKENGRYWLINKKGNIITDYFDSTDCLLVALFKADITHYQPIEKPKLPIF